MKRKSLLVWFVLTALVFLTIAPGSAAARAVKVGFTGAETTLGLVDPGVWIELPSGNVHVRGMISLYEESASDPRMSGVATVVMNANWGPDYAGPMWGTSQLEVAPGPECVEGGVWEASWTGTMNVDGSYSYHAVGLGVSGCVEGLRFSFVAENPGGGGLTTYNGEILDPHGE